MLVNLTELNQRFSYTVLVQNSSSKCYDHSELIAWIDSNIGEFSYDWHWEIRYDSDRTIVYKFKTQEDLVRFTLTCL